MTTTTYADLAAARSKIEELIVEDLEAAARADRKYVMLANLHHADGLEQALRIINAIEKP